MVQLTSDKKKVPVNMAVLSTRFYKPWTSTLLLHVAGPPKLLFTTFRELSIIYTSERNTSSAVLSNSCPSAPSQKKSNLFRGYLGCHAELHRFLSRDVRRFHSHCRSNTCCVCFAFVCGLLCAVNKQLHWHVRTFKVRETIAEPSPDYPILRL